MIRDISLGVLGFVACAIVGGVGDSLRQRGDTLTTADIVHLLLLVLAVIYVHWLLRVFVMPLSGLPRSERVALVGRAMKRYGSGFFRGTVGFGYFLLLLNVLGFVTGPETASETPNFALGAIFFIGLGVLAQARGLMLALTNPELDIMQLKHGSSEPNAAPPGNARVTEGAQLVN